jgi:hypothetical protein
MGKYSSISHLDKTQRLDFFCWNWSCLYPKFSFNQFGKNASSETILGDLHSFSKKIGGDYRGIYMKKSTGKAIPCSGPILTTDVDRFNDSDRTDLDRTAIRTVLQLLISVALKKRLPAYEKKVKFSDTGDGLLVLFPSDTPKKTLLEKFLPSLERLVKKHNSQTKSAAKFLVRAALHHGDYFQDKPKLTKIGYTGAEINNTFRILNSDILREAVRRQGAARPIALFLSEYFYTKIVAQQIPSFKNFFARRIVKGKDGEITAWLFVDRKLLSNQRTAIKQPSKKSGTAQTHKSHPLKKQSVKLADLPPSIYVSAADIHNFNLYQRNAESVPLANHLETALLLGHCAIVHCTDPYRSQEVFNLLTEFQHFIKTGKICFLLGSSIESPKSGFIKYITEKASQYEKSGHGKADIDSLSQSDPKADIEAAVIEMLDLSPYLLHRGYGGTDVFVKAVKKDFEQAETLATTADPFSGKLQHTNLTLRQILSLAQIGNNGKVTPLVAKKDQIEKIINQLNQKINNRSFSRQILLSLFREELKGRNLDAAYFDLLEIRTNLLHLKINVGSHNFTEFHPQREKNSPYDHDHLLDHLGVLGKRAAKERCGVELVKTLKALPEWQSFATHHLRVMADLYARRLGDLDTEPNGFFLQSRNMPAFDKIARIINKQWK